MVPDGDGESWRRRLKRIARSENKYIRMAFSEFFGTFTHIFLLDAMIASAVFGRIQPDGSKGPSPPLFQMAYGAGVSVVAGLLVSGASGGHLNPAVTGAFALLGRISLKKTVVYWIAQYTGALAGAATTYGIYRDSFDRYDGGKRAVHGENATAGIFATYPISHISWISAIFDQVASTAVLMFGILAIIDNKNWGLPKAGIPMHIGLLISGLVLGVGFNTGAAMNPARDLMPRLFTLLAGWGPETFSVWDYKWFLIPIFGSHAGAICGALIYQVLVAAHWLDADNNDYVQLEDQNPPKGSQRDSNCCECIVLDQNTCSS